MPNNFRIITLAKIAANMGILTSLVRKTLNLDDKPKFVTLGSVGPGTSIMMPENCVKADGSVDILINIRGIPGGDTKRAANLGVNAVIVTAEAGGMGNKENVKAYGNADFVNNAVSSVIAHLKKQFPNKNIHRGKLAVSGFSGGAGAAAHLLLEKDKIQGGLDGIILNDGLHSDPNSPVMKAVVDFARESENDPSKKFVLTHTAITPQGYASTTDTANYLLSQLGVSRQPVTEWNGSGVKPRSAAKAGGLSVYQLYDKEPPYMAKNPRTGQMQANVIGDPNNPLTNGGQHIVANNSLGDYAKDIFK